MTNQSDENPIARDLLKALGHPPSSILGISLAISGQFVGAVLLIATGSDRFNAHHAKLFATLKEPFFVAMSNALKHREVLKLKDLLADDNRFLQDELRRKSGDEIVGAIGLLQEREDFLVDPAGVLPPGVERLDVDDHHVNASIRGKAFKMMKLL